MTGLEKILKHIEEDASAAAATIIAEAEKKAEVITSDAKAEGEKKCREIAERSKLDVEAYLSRAESAALLQEKKLILNAKQKAIGNIITRAKDSLLKLSDKEYFEIIIKMAQKNVLSQPGQIVFSKVDKGRLPQQFESSLHTSLLNIEGAELSVSDETRNIDGGFILIYGDVEVNCSFDALFFAARESLQDKVCEVLFQ